MTAPSVFALPAAKDTEALLSLDRAHFGRVRAAHEHQVSTLTDHLRTVVAAPGGVGRAALDRDTEVHRLTRRLRTLEMFSLDLCLGRMVPSDGTPPLWIGRVGLSDAAGERLLLDWRTPAAAPWFAATPLDPQGLESRRRYRWQAGRVVDLWDEQLVPGSLSTAVSLDADQAFLASLTGARDGSMRDVLGTIQVDQDAIVRASARGPLVVDGGPGTGKTVVALHRTAHLLHSDPRLGERQGGVLVLGPHRPYLNYVADVLPALGEHDVATCTLLDLVPGAEAFPEEIDRRVRDLKSGAQAPHWVEPAVALYEEPPTVRLGIETPWGDLQVTPRMWAAAFACPEVGTPHNAGRDQVWEWLVVALVDQFREEYEAERWDDPDWEEDREEVAERDLRQALRSDRGLAETFSRAWPLLEPADVVADLFSVKAYLRACAPELAPEEVVALQRPDPYAFTRSDVPLLDAARLRVGDPDAVRRHHAAQRRARQDEQEMSRAIEHILAADLDGDAAVRMLHGADLRAGLSDPQSSTSVRTLPAEALAGPYAHVVIDEAQELTDAQWQMVLRRVPSGSVTVVGDRAQAREGFTESWRERLARVGLAGVGRAGVGRAELRVMPLSVNYRTPSEVMAQAAPVIRAVMPDAAVPTSVRTSGRPVRHGLPEDLADELATWLREHSEGTAVVIGASTEEADSTREQITGHLGPDHETGRVTWLDATRAKGLEFDLVVLVRPEAFGADADHPDHARAVDTYVAMTRATSDLVVLTDQLGAQDR